MKYETAPASERLFFIYDKPQNLAQLERGVLFQSNLRNSVLEDS